MIAIQIVLILASLGFVAYRVVTGLQKEKFPIGSVVFASAVFIVVAFVLIPSFGQVPAGHRGVVLRFGAVTGRTLDEGLFFITPFVESVELMDLQVHADKSTATAASRDLQNVSTEVTVNYRLDHKRVAEVYRDLRNDYVARVMVPAIQEAVKSATAQFEAERLVIERQKVKDQIESILQVRLRQHGIIVDGIAITNFQFSSDFANAIEAKVTSQQLALKARNDLEIVKAEQQQAIVRAEAQAQAIRIQAQAINAQGGKEYVALKAIEKWKGDVPQWMGGGQPVPFVNLGSLDR